MTDEGYDFLDREYPSAEKAEAIRRERAVQADMKRALDMERERIAITSALNRARLAYQRPPQPLRPELDFSDATWEMP